MTFSKRLAEAMKICEMNQAELSRATGIGRSAISQYLQGLYEAKQDKIYLMAKALSVDPAWLMGLNVPMRGKEFIKDSTKTVPLIGDIAAGSPILAEENIEDYFNIDSSVDCDFCLRIRGSSMIDEGIKDGDIAFIRQQPNLENGEIGAIVIEDKATLKRFYRNDGQIILQPANKDYQPIILTNGNVHIAGKLVAVLNMYK